MSLLLPPPEGSDWPWAPIPRLHVFVWDQHAAEDPDSLAYHALAVSTGQPIRVLLDGAIRLPEDAFLHCRDLKVARISTGPEALRQVAAWVQEVQDA